MALVTVDSPAPNLDDSRVAPLLSYPLHVSGEDTEGVGWVYTVSSRSLLHDAFTSISLKRALEQNADAAAVRHPYVVGRCAVAGDEDVERALAAASAAAPEWARVPLERRMELGAAFRKKLLEHEDEFLELLVAEGHPRALARWELSCLLQVYSEESCSWYQRNMYAEFGHGGRRLAVRRRPDGVVCLNPPQNAPAPSAALAVLMVMAGNAVVVRAPRSIALSTMYVLRELAVPLLAEAGAPPGTLNLVCGNPGRMLRQWVDSPLVNDIFYIGSVEEGLKLEQECVAKGKKPVLELAGNDGVVVWADANLEHAAEAVAECFYGSGQICMVPNYVVAHPAIAGELIGLVAAQAARIRPGDPDDEDVLLSPVRRTESFFALLDQTMGLGSHLVCGGNRIEADGTASGTGVFLEPTVVRVDGLARAREHDVVREETFFPLLPIVVPEPELGDGLLDHVLDFVDANEYGLRNSLWTRSEDVVDAFVDGVGNGGLLKVNDSHIGFLPYLPSHGGTGLTGGAFGEANYPMFRTTHLQGVGIANGVSPQREILGRVLGGGDGAECERSR
ncbi:aldehyde dehydrogenase [Amycolatopsis rubida]|uniref:Aldehyde dehydrogenase n=1 Tax=Amycolatopsis rubida TaxID=112413 RepID=A0ABX0C153_9PSEU|nr:MULTISPECIES: aldehyde dehydrogenase [Amycolatopsis]MYW93790.1 aldehyde dehydrogenase family protein [Amycolatopsis rubida]NEC58780.1 aldehyde dehydrogenase [Amycolatopsis rubida]OAP22979.1 Succinate-semialdehyde dehydrogenase [NADP(+)] GabD [Amycolatopsis sp. M39]